MRIGTKLINVSNGLVSRFVGMTDGMYTFVDQNAPDVDFSDLTEDQAHEFGYSLIESDDFFDMLTCGECKLEA